MMTEEAYDGTDLKWPNYFQHTHGDDFLRKHKNKTQVTIEEAYDHTELEWPSTVDA